MAEPYIKLYRKMLKWEWYDDVNTCRVFLHCLLRANWQETRWHGEVLKPGQFITSTANLAKETQLSVKQVRVALDHLISTGEVASKGQSKYRIITVLKWDEYQGEGKQTASKGQAEGKQGATDKEYKEYKESKELKNIYGEYRHVKLTDSERNKLMDEYGEAETSEAIKYLDEYIEMKGYKARSHYLAIKKWVFDAVKRDNPKKEQEQSIFDAWMNA